MSAPAVAPSFFEGPEKKVELVVREGIDLRSFGDELWHTVVQASKAQVLSQIANEHCIAYLLSESSLFVYEDHLTMITCGRTRLVDAVGRILERIPTDDIALLVYERKNEHFPDRQPSSFYEDAQRLQAWLGGEAFRFGDEHDHHVHVFHTTKPYTAGQGDTTLEILMHGLPEDRASRFIGCQRPEGSTIAAERGITKFLPDFAIDEHPFTPAGYSVNGIRGDDYYTIHVTPEVLGSYVSFETNVDFRGELSGLVRHVVEVFDPRSFDVVSFTPEGTPPGDLILPDYHIKDRVRARLNGYEVAFWHAYAPREAPRPPAPLSL
jgi:S-adenosylmethionine decarboxylase